MAVEKRIDVRASDMSKGEKRKKKKPSSSKKRHSSTKGSKYKRTIYTPRRNVHLSIPSIRSDTPMDVNTNQRITTNDMKDRMSSGQSNVFVALRVRPLLRKEKDQGCRDIIRVLNKKIVVVLDPGVDSDDVLRMNRSREKRYAFDYVFDESTSQIDVFKQSVSFLLEGVLNGYNATVFAYGATGSGKTFTMLGSENEPGLMLLTLQMLFEMAEGHEGKDNKISLSYIEIYNETIRDLLNPSNTEVLDLREDSTKGVKIIGVTEYQANSADEVMVLLKKGNRNRTQEPTNMNEESSRSHAVLQVVVEQRDRTRDTNETVQIGKLSLIDLAGSERAAVSQNRGLRLLEGANINRSLLALGNCINALGDRQNKGSYVPYRDSKLTRLLKDSLGGNCRTVMIATIAPSHVTMEDTINTLKYANRAKNIKTKVTRNELSVNHHIVEYEKIVAALRSEIRDLKQRLHHDKKGTSPSSFSENSLFHKLKKDFVDNFEDRLQIRQSIRDIEAQDRETKLEIDRSQEEISRTEFSKLRESMRDNLRLRRDISMMTQNIQSNAEVIKEHEMMLTKLESAALILHKSLQAAANTPELKEILELLYRTQLQDLEISELTTSSKVKSNALKAKDLYIQKLEQQIRIRDKIIYNDKVTLTSHGISISEEEAFSSLKTYIETELLLGKSDSISHSSQRRDGEQSTSGLYEQMQKAYHTRRVENEKENHMKRVQSRINSSKSLVVSDAQSEIPMSSSPILEKQKSEIGDNLGFRLPRMRGTYQALNNKASYDSLELLRKNSKKLLDLPSIKSAVLARANSLNSSPRHGISVAPLVFSSRLSHNSKRIP